MKALLNKTGESVYIVLLGAPGAGKGTQAVMLADKMKLVQVASGDLFRKALQGQTELGKKAKVYMDKGQLVPNEITIQMVLERLAAPDVKEGAILDGFPRNTEQAKALDKALKAKSMAIDKAVNIKVTEEEVLKRLSGRWVCRNCQTPYHQTDNPPKVKGVCDRCSGELYQRDDDKPETIKNRLLVYLKETAPLVDYYKKAGKLVEVVSEGGPANVNKKIISALR
jgi:adenylate kinase